MYKIIIIVLFFTLITQYCTGQHIGSLEKETLTGKKDLITAGLNIPLHNFSSTHFAGFSVSCAISNHRFGIMKKKPLKQFGLSANIGVAYYLGKKENVVSTTYHYPAYIFLHLQGGVVYNPAKKINICISTGPGVSLYNKTTRFAIGASLEGSYYVNNRIAITPGFTAMKESISDPLYTGSLSVSYAF